jgi:hypothetical protein
VKDHNESELYHKISNGIPQYGEIVSGDLKYEYFAFSSTNSTPVYITVNEYTNDLDVYINIFSHDINPNDWTYPTSEDFIFNSQDHMGVEVIYLQQEDLRECHYGCTIIIGVKTNLLLADNSLSSTFLITANRGIQTILEGLTIN